MTSATGAGEHPEVSEISDLTDGLLSPSRATDLRDHLAGCSVCEDVYASLEEIRGLLGTLPGPTRMPADVAERIDAALAAEALLDAAAAKDEPHVSRETSAAPLSVSRETSAQTPPRASAAAPPAGRSRGTSGPGRQTPGRRPSRSRRWPRVLLSTAAAAAVLGVGGLLLQSAGSSGVQATKQEGSSSASPGTPSGLTEATLGTNVHKLLAEKKTHPTPKLGTRSSPETPLRGETDIVPSCVRQGIGRTEHPLASTRSTYEGKDAFLVVLPHPSDPTSVSAYVVTASCVSAAPPAPGKVLLTHSYRRD
ncbi:anti-sigma factor family protein [Streptomyces sp. NPDC057555]|uniref:anti-sigma factor family protein n=1 Tax=Streptomyces sp. NPDC057555 TaxID=3346166 RepID=UPI00367EA24B